MSQVVGNTALAYARVWHHVDASERIVGKLAERIALVLMGKHKPIYDPGVDCGDYVVVTNCAKIKSTGRKPDQFMFRKHSMYPGGLKEVVYKDMMIKKPEEIIRHAVSGMLPKNKLRDRRLERLRIFPGSEMGITEMNLFRSFHDGTLPPDWNPQPIAESKPRILPKGFLDKLPSSA
ncbi:60S ribosomal protein L23 [Cylindrobasidium torrendii FP15055 ss-10]|uniref:60S ribosomal protein L23 n=1 Tax=Cylindrobasidium torrendii FP15055 ss-10 TaxID=1314674 RepID=A0A0D7AXA0_9AGAR|nr:60S ribosomal protein L23 [Cylindrobasidium torrendii FP15055 ss-10]